MATTERATEPALADDVAASCSDAGLVSLIGAPRGGALSAVGLLANALDAIDIPFQARIGDSDPLGTEADVSIAIGAPNVDAGHAIGPEAATEVAAALGGADPVLAVAATSAGSTTAGDPGGLERRSGLGVPTADPVDGLAHSTLVHGPFSGEPKTARTVIDPHVDGTDDGARRERASAAVLAVASEAPPDSRAGAAVERILKPHIGGPFATVEGYADVLD
ncbi:MAG: recombinase RecJ, partial [Salinirussus sp.]